MIKQEQIDISLIKSEPIDFSTSDIVSEFLGTGGTSSNNDQPEPMDQDVEPPPVSGPPLTTEQPSTTTIGTTGLQTSNTTSLPAGVVPIKPATRLKIIGIQQKAASQQTKVVPVRPTISGNQKIYIGAGGTTSPSKVIAITGGAGNMTGRLVQSIGGPPQFQLIPSQANKISSHAMLKPIAPRFSTTVSSGQQPPVATAQIQVKPVVTRDSVQQASESQPVTTSVQQPRLLLQAMPTGQCTQQLRTIAPNLGGLQPGTAIQLPVGTIIKDGVVYVPQHQVQPGSSTGGIQLSTVQINQTAAGNANNQQMNTVVQEQMSPTRQRKPCNCTKSQCLKLYCDCFANGEFCSNCNCNNCSNNIEHEGERSKAIKACLERNPHAFHPKIGKGKGETERRHNKGCHCKRSGCLKNYCECYEAKILCTNLCKCTGCKNFEESPERKTLMHLADAAEVRVQQQNAARTKLESQMEDLPSRAPILAHAGEKLPFSFITRDVVEATCRCLLLQAAAAEKNNKSQSETQKSLLEEFGNCLLKIIHTANKPTAC